MSTDNTNSFKVALCDVKHYNIKALNQDNKKRRLFCSRTLKKVSDTLCEYAVDLICLTILKMVYHGK